MVWLMAGLLSLTVVIALLASLVTLMSIVMQLRNINIITVMCSARRLCFLLAYQHSQTLLTCQQGDDHGQVCSPATCKPLL